MRLIHRTALWEGDTSPAKLLFLSLALFSALMLTAHAGWPFRTVSAKEAPTHLKAHLWEYFDPTADPFMKGDLLWMKGDMTEIKIIRSDDGKSYEVTFLMERYPMSHPWQNYTEENAWRRIAGRDPDVESTPAIIGKLAGIMEKHSLGNQKTADVLKDDNGAVDGVWNRWKVVLPLTRRDAVFELVSVYFSTSPPDAAIRFHK